MTRSTMGNGEARNIGVVAALAAAVALAVLALSSGGGSSATLSRARSASPAPAAAPSAGPVAGSVSEHSFSSPALARRTLYDIYLPPRYRAEAAHGRRFPVLYLLHTPDPVPLSALRQRGIAARADELIRAGGIRPLILVVPLGTTTAYGGDTEWTNSPAGPFDSYLLDAVRFIDGHYATRADRRDRGLAGWSMGGYGAVNLALRHLGMFSLAESFSGYFTQTPTGPYAGASPAELAAASPSATVPRLARQIRRLGLRAWLFQGTEDDVSATDTRAFAQELAAAGGNVTVDVVPGRHNWGLWTNGIPGMLRLADRTFRFGPR